MRSEGPSWSVDRPSPLQNRVTPWGEIVADTSRGLMMGNRGCVHREDRTLGVSRWRSKMWICCVLSWRDVRRDVMTPGRWTALFFLDEVTALSAGHRPCGYCRRQDHVTFAKAWGKAHSSDARPRAAEMDVVLHAERVESRTRKKLVRPVALGSLPDGAMVVHCDEPHLVARGALLPWSFAGYGPGQEVEPQTVVGLLTPPGIVAAIWAGYRPLVHPSVRAPGLRTLSVEGSFEAPAPPSGAPAVDS